jgi:hypothetical protein
MQILSPNRNAYVENQGIQSQVSFLPFYQFIKAKTESENSTRKEFLRYICDQFEQNPQLLQPVNDPTGLQQYSRLLELVAAAIFPVTLDETTSFYSFSAPYLFTVFYYSDAFGLYFTKDADGQKELAFPQDVSFDKIRQENLNLAYKLILKKFYNFDLNVEEDLMYKVTDPVTGLPRYGKVSVDERFVDVTLTGELPKLNTNALCQKTFHIMDAVQLQKDIPLSAFSFFGFLVRNITDITTTAFINEIKDAILTVESTHDEAGYIRLLQSIQGLVELKDARVNLVSCIRINNEIVPPMHYKGESVVIQELSETSDPNAGFKQFTGHFSENSQPILLQNIAQQSTMYDMPFITGLAGKRNGSIILYPVYDSKQLIGVLEIYSAENNHLNQSVLSKLALIYPLLVMSFSKYQDKIEQDINNILKNEFTAIQPTVEWKFTDIAWQQLQQKIQGEEDTVQGDIIFSEVYPLYGAIDIRNSSVERMAAIKQDMTEQLLLTEETCTKIKAIVNLPLLDVYSIKAGLLRKEIEAELNAETELRINDFLEHEIKNSFAHFLGLDEKAATVINRYYQLMNDAKGPMHEHRRGFDDSLGSINTWVAKLLEMQQKSVQASYPFYFEKYRSDGIEYNIYIGQSLSPNRKFDWLYLKNLRLWQLGSMAELAVYTHTLATKLKHPLKTTQLILAHHNAIDISFRKDERKFDVEGAYNIRYEVIKKRLDKALIKDTGERLTQPGKIAIVFSYASDADEYLEYIQMLQYGGKLLPGHEMLELENMQGVSGLKALRVSVNYEATIK